MNKKQIIRQLFIFSAVIGAIILIFQIVWPQVLYDKIWWLLIFFILLTVSSLLIIGYATAKNPKNFMVFYFSAMIARLFISILVAAVFILLDKNNVLVFAVNFTTLYLLFLGFEIYSILINLRHHFGTRSGEQNQQLR
jgi:hypothetical protein